MDLMIESLPRLLNATKLTIELTLLSLFFGIFVGVFFAILRTSKNRVFYFISYYYSYIFRGTPLLVQIFIIYFGLGQVEWIRESFLWIVLKEPYSCAILAFTLNTGAYSSDIFRSAFVTINKGVVEAAKGLGRSNIGVMYSVTLPLVRSGVIVAMALVFLITMKELTATLILGPLGFKTLATQVWSFTSEAFFAKAAFPALLIILLSSIPTAFIMYKNRDLRL